MYVLELVLYPNARPSRMLLLGAPIGARSERQRVGPALALLLLVPLGAAVIGAPPPPAATLPLAAAAAGTTPTMPEPSAGGSNVAADSIAQLMADYMRAQTTSRIYNLNDGLEVEQVFTLTRELGSAARCTAPAPAPQRPRRGAMATTLATHAPPAAPHYDHHPCPADLLPARLAADPPVARPRPTSPLLSS